MIRSREAESFGSILLPQQCVTAGLSGTRGGLVAEEGRDWILSRGFFLAAEGGWALRWRRWNWSINLRSFHHGARLFRKKSISASRVVSPESILALGTRRIMPLLRSTR